MGVTAFFSTVLFAKQSAPPKSSDKTEQSSGTTNGTPAVSTPKPMSIGNLPIGPLGMAFAGQAPVQISQKPKINSISPPKILVGEHYEWVTITGSDFGSSPTVNLPTGVHYDGREVSDTQIKVYLFTDDTATVGETSISVTAIGETSDAFPFVLDGPYQMKVISDNSGPCEGCKATIQRVMIYQVINFSLSNAGPSTFCEQPNIQPSATGPACSGGTPHIIANVCGIRNLDSIDGQIPDTWTLSSDNVSPVGCGMDVTDPWYWAYTSPRTLLGIPSGYVHTNSIEIDNVVSPQKLRANTIMPKK